MECPTCHHENPEDARFCNDCGKKLEVICPECNKVNPLGSRFCNGCGNALQKPSETAPIDLNQPQSYTPKHLADKILTTRTAIEGERKLVTVFFADVANFTSISEKLDPEEVHQIMDGAFKILMDEIHKYEGTINQFTGDGVMALFGAPVAHEDHAQRACYAALAIQNAMGDYGDKIEKDTGVAFRMRVGLNSGPVIVGAIGDDLRMDYTAVGDTTNLGSRMEGMARPGSVLVSGNTHRLVRDFFEFRSLGKVEVKGKKEPQEAFELIKEGEVGTRIGASIAKGLTRFVGRKNSMAALMDVYAKAKDGSGQVVGLVGEAGVGKSRLLLEFRHRIAKNQITYLEGRCIHFGGAMPYLPILDIMKSYFNIKETEREAALKKRVAETILKLDATLQKDIPPLQDLLSLTVTDENYLKLGPKQRKERLFEALRDVLIRTSQQQTLVIAVEDLHWIDKTSEEFIDYFIGWMAKTTILLVLLYRPEYTHQWGGKSYFNRIGVNELTRQSSTELVKAILEGGYASPELDHLILNRAAGNPFFMEELTHNLMENGTIKKKKDLYVLTRPSSDIQVPQTVQGIIAARIDRLEENLKKIMQVASVIGREFTFRILQAIVDMREELKAHLMNLQGLELIYEKCLFPELEYIFRHALTQEVAYNSLLSARRKEIHQRIAVAIEDLYDGNLEEFYEVLVHHYGHSGNHEKTMEYLDLANRKATRLYALQDAMGYFNKAMNLLDTLPDTQAHRLLRISMLVNNVFVFQLLDQFPVYYDLLIRHESVALSLDRPDLLGGFYARKANCEWQFGRFDESIESADKAIDLCEACGNAFDGGYACMLRQSSLLYKSNYEAVLALKEKVIRLHKKAFFLRSYVYSFCASSMANIYMGRWDEAVMDAKTALKAAVEYSDPSLSSFAAMTISCAYCAKQDMDKAIKFAELAVRKASSPMDKQWAQNTRTWVYCRAGQPEKDLAYLAGKVREYRRAGVHVWSVTYGVCLGECYLLNNQFDEAARVLGETLQLAKMVRMKLYEALCLILLGEISIETDLPLKETPSVDACFENAISICREIKAEGLLALAYKGYGRYCKTKGDISTARQYLKQALEIFDRLGTLVEPDKIREELAELPNT